MITGKNLFGRIILSFERGLNQVYQLDDGFTCLVFGVINDGLCWLLLSCFFSSIYLLVGGYIGSEFFPKSDRGEFLVQIEMPLKDASN